MVDLQQRKQCLQNLIEFAEGRGASNVSMLRLLFVANSGNVNNTKLTLVLNYKSLENLINLQNVTIAGVDTCKLNLFSDIISKIKCAKNIVLEDVSVSGEWFLAFGENVTAFDVHSTCAYCSDDVTRLFIQCVEKTVEHHLNAYPLCAEHFELVICKNQSAHILSSSILMNRCAIHCV